MAYVIDVEPNVLLIGITGRNPFAFEVRIDHQCRVIPFLDPADLHALLDALDIERDPQNPFSVRSFFEFLDTRVPNQLKAADVPPPDFVAQFWGDNVEESHKIYFVGWRHNPAGFHVTHANLAKTHQLIGQGAHDSCARLNISSCWTADRDEKKSLSPPR